MKIEYERVFDSDACGKLHFTAENAGDGHTLGSVSRLLECELLSDNQVKYSLDTGTLMLLLIKMTEERSDGVC
ncbi:hypothetical protein LCGC14_0234830 [marine sediment metagenome]|uniref:Uncharacterized protein n=1 Tax=marine sediment metagenome TaxID=412755 RepID=A0A0F9UQ41_9ZZZZ